MTIEKLQTIWEAEATLKNYLSSCEKLDTEIKEKTITNESYQSWRKIIESTKNKLINQLTETKLDFTNCQNFSDYLQTLENAKYTH